MRWSRTFIPTLREDPADASAPSHRLLVRGGFIRQLMAGSYSLLPLGVRVARKISGVIREEMNAIGGQEFLAPVVHPGELWKKTGRWDDVEGIMVKFEDRKGADLVLALTHEEVFAHLAAELSSYKELPQLWYHLQTKFRDEARPRSGLLRVREFTMKDSYSLDLDEAGLDVQFEAHRGAYRRIFDRLGLETVQVEASSGNMGGSSSVEFAVRSDTGEDRAAVCGACGYAANLERAVSRADPVADDPWEGPPEAFPTPGVRTIAALAEAGPFAAPHRQIKTLAYSVGGRITLAVLRGDHQLEEQKLADAAAGPVRPASETEIVEALGARPGSIGAVGVDLPVLADPALRGRSNMVTGANRDGFHLRGVDAERDVPVDRWVDLRTAADGEACGRCPEGALEVSTVIEVGHIFKLGRKYSEALGASVLDESGRPAPLVMGSYGIGVGRAMAAVAEVSRDDRGIIWPLSVAPFSVVITALRADRPEVMEACAALYGELSEAGAEVLWDDRDERPGVKFADAELVGIPYRLTVGPRGLASGEAELQSRGGAVREAVPLDRAAARIRELIGVASGG